MNPLQLPAADPSLHGNRTVRTRLWAQIAIYVLMAGLLARGFSTFTLFSVYRTVDGMRSGDLHAAARLNQLVDFNNTWGTLSTVVVAAGTIAALTWIYQAHKTFNEIGIDEPEVTAGWAVGGWFVPIMNLWMPVKSVQHLWRATAPVANGNDLGAWKVSPRTPIAWLWWALYLVANFSGRLFVSKAAAAQTLDQLHSAIGLGLISNLIGLAGQVLWIWLILIIARRHLERGRMVAELRNATYNAIF